jgi:transglutaminase-like putative cysteine protease
VGLATVLSLGAEPGTGLFETRTLDPAIKRALVDAFPDLPEFSSLAGHGFAFSEERLGEKPRLARTPLFRVQSDRDKIIYLRTKVFDTYAGNTWSSILISLGKTDDATGGILNVAAADPHPVTVTVLFDYLPLLPHRLSTRSIRLPAQDLSRVKSGSIETGFTLTLPLLKNDRLILLGGRRESSGGIAALRDRVEKALGVTIESQSGAPQEKQTALLDTYRALPAAITPRTRRLAASLGRGKRQSWAVLVAIYRYLRDHCQYSLKTTPPPQGVEFTDHFLFTTRKGYAVHFATAFAVLARLNRIPARFVKGFIAVMPRFDDETEVSGLNAHAWPEVWFPELGWTTLEATPAVDVFRAYGPGYYARFNPDHDDVTGRQLEAIMGGVIPVPEKEKPDFARAVIPVLPWLAAVALGVLLVLTAVMLLRRLRTRRCSYRGPRAGISRALRRLVRRGERQAIPSPAHIGWTAWGERCIQLKKADPRRIRLVVGLVQRIYFSALETGPGRARVVRGLCRRLASRLKTSV